MPKKQIWPRIVWPALFCGILAYFVFGSGWYPDSLLEVTGIASGPGAKILIRWESGEGFNPYEQEVFLLDTVWPGGTPVHTIRVRRTGRKGGGSLDSDVRMYGILFDQKREMPLKDLISEDTVIDGKGRLWFQKAGSAVRLTARAENHIRFEFPTNNRSGGVAIELNGRTRTYDLYTSNSENWKRGDEHTRRIDYWVISPDGSFRLTMPLPRYRIRTLVIESADGSTPLRFRSVLIQSDFGKKRLPSDPGPVQNVVFSDFDSGRKRYWHPTRFAFQCAFAALSTWILLALFGGAKKYSGLYDMFVNDRRYVFWLLFGGAILVFSLWLIAFWPGVMSVDSLKVWRAARIPGLFLNDHPILNVVFYMYLMQIWDHIAVVPITQIVLSSLLGSYLLFSLYRKGICLQSLMPFYLLFVFSIPVGLYNIVLWKDIPFALLVAYWAFILADMYHKKREGNLTISSEKWIVLLLLCLSLALFRHNGIVYLLVIPILFAILGIVSIKKVIVGAVIFFILSGIGLLIVRTKMRVMDAGYLVERGKYFWRNFSNAPIESVIKRATSKYFYILDINQKQSRWDLWHYYLRDRYAYGFLKQAGWNDIYPYLKPNRYPIKWLHDLGLKVYRQTYRSPWVYFTWNPVYMLALFLLTVALLWMFPLSAVFSVFILAQVATLLLIFSLNWRYFYFAVFASYFLIPVMLLDMKRRWSRIAPEL